MVGWASNIINTPPAGGLVWHQKKKKKIGGTPPTPEGCLAHKRGKVGGHWGGGGVSGGWGGDRDCGDEVNDGGPTSKYNSCAPSDQNLHFLILFFIVLVTFLCFMHSTPSDLQKKLEGHPPPMKVV